MNYIQLVLCYKGKDFFGFQYQPDKRTVASELSKALEKVYKLKIVFTASGRTDTGVHAEGQVVNYQTPKNIPLLGLKRALNNSLPDDIYILDIKKVESGFNARRSAKSREYRYLFANKEVPFCFKEYVFETKFRFKKSDLKIIRKAIIGRHDFKNFRCIGSNKKNTVREIYDFNIIEKEVEDIYSGTRFRVFELRIEANSFLYRMVRNIMGALLEMLRGKQKVEDFIRMIHSNEKIYKYTLAPAKGLTLFKVNY